ncbi:MAG TPA: single-stranded DNA-binding protein [Vampirovibrionales bacterium]
MNIARAVITGEVTEESELRYTNNNTAVLNLPIKTGNNVDMKLICYGKLAESAKESLKVGDKVFANGNLTTYSKDMKKEFQINVKELSKFSGSLERVSGAQGSFSSQNKEEDLSDVLSEEVPF